MTVYMRQDAHGNRHVVNEETYLANLSSYGKRIQIIINTSELCVYRPPVAPGMMPAMPALKYGGRGRGWKNPVGYGGY